MTKNVSEYPKRKPQWFSTAVDRATNSSCTIACNPFPQNLRNAIEDHIFKTRERRAKAFNDFYKQIGTYDDEKIQAYKIKKDVEADLQTYKEILTLFHSCHLSTEGSFQFDTQKYPIRELFLDACQLPQDFDLTLLHEDLAAKKRALYSLSTKRDGRIKFQEVFDHFVRAVCAPHLISLLSQESNESESTQSPACTEIYYQAFPCIRIVQPHDFSIGPHADIMYGHHPCTVNYYLPLTCIHPDQNTCALFLESKPNAEDWHPIVGNYGQCVKHFAGATNMHFTVENKTGKTRVSLDFRLIPGFMFNKLPWKHSQFVKKDGYYSKCKLQKKQEINCKLDCTNDVDLCSDKNNKENVGEWIRVGDLLPPDSRVGYPWTVKNWD